MKMKNIENGMRRIRLEEIRAREEEEMRVEEELIADDDSKRVKLNNDEGD